jgi:hypothetical protein
MKKIMMLIPALMVTFMLFAQNYSNLTIGNTIGSNLKIRLAGKQYSLQDQKVTFQYLTPGTYRLQIYRRVFKGAGYEWSEVYNNDIILTAQKHLEIIVMRFGKVVWDEGNMEDDEWNQNYQNPNGNQNSQSGQAMDDTQFQRAKKTISDASSFDKMNTMKAVFRNNLFTTAQVRKLMDEFSSFDLLDFLKYAYDYTVDKGNYFTLADDISSSFTKSSFMDFLRTK